MLEYRLILACLWECVCKLKTDVEVPLIGLFIKKVLTRIGVLSCLKRYVLTAKATSESAVLAHSVRIQFAKVVCSVRFAEGLICFAIPASFI